MRGAASIVASAVITGFALRASAQSPTDNVRVHIASDDEVFLQRIENRKWVDVCFSPCDRIVDADVRYRIEGPGVRPTSPFVLHATSLEGHETLVVKPSHDLTRASGFVLVGVGSAGVFAGLFMLWLNVASEECEGSNVFPSSQRCGSMYPQLAGIGLATMATSVIVAGVGTFIAITSSHSSVHQMASTPRPEVRLFANLPQSRREGSPTIVRDSSAIVAPIVSVSF